MLKKESPVWDSFFYFISMEALYKMVQNINELRQGVVLFKTMSDNPRLKELVTHLNTEKQLQFGLLSDDTILPNYSQTSIEVYGKPDRPIMLKDTGEFWRSFEVILSEDGFEIDGQSIKFDFEPVDLIDVVDYWGLKGENVYGLNKKNMSIFIDALLPKIQKTIEKEILKKR